MKGKFAHIQKPSPLVSRIRPSEDDQTWVYDRPKKRVPLDISQLPTGPQQQDDNDGDKKPAAKASQPKAATQTPKQQDTMPMMPPSPKPKGKGKLKKQSTPPKGTQDKAGTEVDVSQAQNQSSSDRNAKW